MLRSLRPIVYAQLQPDRLSVRDARTGRSYAARPLGAVLSGPVRRVVRIGDDALTASAGRPLEIVNPFKHPRMLIADFTLGQQVLKGFLRKLYASSLLPRRPVLVLHPRIDPEGGFTEIEIRALRELALGAGASRVFVWHGRELLQRELLGLQFNSGGRLLS
jgi:rod shape-determining protein MreB and related proteins